MTKPIAEKYVLCEFCKQKIHIDHWGGVARLKDGDKEIWFCDKLPCLIEYQERRKK